MKGLILLNSKEPELAILMKSDDLHKAQAIITYNPLTSYVRLLLLLQMYEIPTQHSMLLHYTAHLGPFRDIEVLFP